MSMTDYRIELQEHPQYENGRSAAESGKARHWLVHGLCYKAREAWLLGYDDAISDRMEIEPDD